MLPKWVHRTWAQDEDGPGQDARPVGGSAPNLTKTTQELHRLRTPVLGDLPGPPTTREDDEVPESPSSRQEARIPLGYLSVQLWISTPTHTRRPQKTWEAKRWRRGSGTWPVVLSASVCPAFPKGGRSHLTQRRYLEEERPHFPLKQLRGVLPA